MRLVTAAQMRAMDRETIDRLGVPALLLMEHAGRAVAVEVQRLAPPDASIAVVCGGGNNGGDGFVCARWLGAWGRDVTVFLAAPRPDPGGEAGFHLALCERMGGVVVPITSAAELAHADLDADVIVDALLGTGLATDVRPHHVQVIEAMNRAPALRVAVDVPSGLDADTGQPRGAAVRAHHTVTLGFAKLGLAGDPGLLYAGEILVADIGIPPALADAHDVRAELASAATMGGLLPGRSPTGHKGTHGHLLVVAGSVGKGGAALLTAEAGLRAGAGLVTLATDPAVQRALEGQVREVMVTPFADADDLVALATGKRAVAIGPGMATDPAAALALRRVLAALDLPVVLDADALNHLAGESDLTGAMGRGPRILTPHPGEAARLLGTDTQSVQADRVTAARTLAARSGAVVVLKGARTVVADADASVSINPSGNPGMGTAGSGDVLTGVIGALLAQGASPWDAARAGVYLHGVAGDLARDEVGQVGMTAGDLLARIPRAIRSF